MRLKNYLTNGAKTFTRQVLDLLIKYYKECYDFDTNSFIMKYSEIFAYSKFEWKYIIK